MKKAILMAVFALTTAVAVPAMAQQKEHKARDPKMMTQKMSEKLNFSDAQKAQLEALNKKYPGADFDKKKYREEFRSIMTDDQKKQADEWRAKMKERRAQKKA